MERIFFVRNGDLDQVNSVLKLGARIKMISAVPEIISAYGYAGGRSDFYADDGQYKGDIYAYIVIEVDD